MNTGIFWVDMNSYWLGYNEGDTLEDSPGKKLKRVIHKGLEKLRTEVKKSK